MTEDFLNSLVTGPLDEETSIEGLVDLSLNLAWSQNYCIW